MRALGNDLARIFRLEADELAAIVARRIAAQERALADEIGLAHIDHPAGAKIGSGRRAVGLAADDEVTLLGAKHMDRFGAIGDDAVFLACRHAGLPQRLAPTCRHVDFETEIAGERDPHDARGNAGDAAGAPAHERERRRVECYLVGQLGHQLAALGPGERDGRPLLGNTGAIDAQARPFALQPFLEPVEYIRSVAARRAHQEPVAGEARGNAVVDHQITNFRAAD